MPRQGPFSLVMSQVQNLVRAVGDQLGPDPGRMGGLGAALADLVRERHHPVHGADGGQVDAIIEQDGIHLGRGLVGEPLAVQQGQQRGLLGRRQRRGVRCPRPGRYFVRGRDGITLAVQRRP